MGGDWWANELPTLRGVCCYRVIGSLKPQMERRRLVAKWYAMGIGCHNIGEPSTLHVVGSLKISAARYEYRFLPFQAAYWLNWRWNTSV